MNLMTKDGRDAYYRQHAVCPQCFSRGTGMEQTCIGPRMGEDHNRCICDCGWRGIVHELIPKQPECVETPGPSDGDERLHAWFGLSYANYLTIPRSILQSMPAEWQGKMADLLTQLDDKLSLHGVVWPPEGCGVDVTIKRESGLILDDDLSEYQRGRRRLW